MEQQSTGTLLKGTRCLLASAMLLHQADIHVSERSGWRTWQPSQQVPGFWIWFLAGFGAKKRGSLFACLWQRGGFGSVTGLFEMEAFIFFCIS